MAEGKFVAYYRVSKKQGQELQQQKDAVARYLNGGEWTLVGSFEERETGKRAGIENRPQLRAAIALAKAQQATLLIAKIDRLARNVHFVSGLMESKVKFVAVDMPTANDLTIHIMAAMAEQEAKAISTRTRERLAVLKAAGVRLGNPQNGTEAQTTKAAQGRRQAADERLETILPTVRMLMGKGHTRYEDLAQMLNFGQVRTARGGKWDAPKVCRMLQRARSLKMI